MKKRPAFIFAFLLLFLSSTLYAKEALISFSAGLQSAFIFYDSEEIKNYNKELNGSHFILGADAGINLNAFEELSFSIGSDFLCDLLKDGSDYSNHLLLDFPFGIKIYPAKNGFAFGVFYVLGICYNFTFAEGNYIADQTSWGNGFKLLAEYNFAHSGKSKYLPSLGAYYKCIPRGNYNTDNIIAAYINFNF